MGSSAKSFVLLQLALLLCISSFLANAYLPPPEKKPLPPPPVKKPVPPPPKKVVIEGVVYCKTCKYKGIPTVNEAAVLPGATVKLQCNSPKYGLQELAKTDKNGYFQFMPAKLAAAFHDDDAPSKYCRVYLVSSALAGSKCSVPTNLRDGVNGAAPVPKQSSPPKGFVVFTVGPFAFDTPKKCDDVPPPPKKVVIEGVVYCKTCKYTGVPTVKGATLLPGAKVKLQCVSPKYRVEEYATTDKNGYFHFIQLAKMGEFASKYCRVYLVSSAPGAKCSVPTNLLEGLKGAVPVPKQASPSKGFLIFTVGPFASEPHKKCYY